ncbi:MAG: hypothetical protein N3F09_09315 [Bacteroidia bacterium]|nr:hypothetical protein [Bacteroidia bacterium]
MRRAKRAACRKCRSESEARSSPAPLLAFGKRRGHTQLKKTEISGG